MSFLTHLNLPFLDSFKQDLIDLYEENKNNLEEFNPPEGRDFALARFRFEDDDISRYIKTIIGDVEFRMMLYKQHNGYEHEKHVDIGGIQCSLNMMLYDNDNPVIFYSGDNIHEFRYDCALLNVSKPHSVPKSNKDRVFLRIAIKEDYDTIRQKIESYCKSSK